MSGMRSGHSRLIDMTALDAMSDECTCATHRSSHPGGQPAGAYYVMT